MFNSIYDLDGRVRRLRPFTSRKRNGSFSLAVLTVTGSHKWILNVSIMKSEVQLAST